MKAALSIAGLLCLCAYSAYAQNAAPPATPKAPPLTADEVTAIYAHYNACWSAMPLSNNMTRVEIIAELDTGGVIRHLTIPTRDEPIYKQSEAYRTTAKNAMAALVVCPPVTFLPKEKYEHWRAIQMTFDPLKVAEQRPRGALTPAPVPESELLNKSDGGIIPKQQIY